MVTQNPLSLLDKLSKHPHGWELAYLVYQLHQDSQRHTQPEPRLVASALDILALLAAQLAHPHGQELAHLTSQLDQDAQKRQTPPEQGLVARALNLAERQGIKHKPYFKGMANEDILGWIDQHSPNQEIN